VSSSAATPVVPAVTAAPFDLMHVLVTITTVLAALLATLVATLLLNGVRLARRDASDQVWLSAVHEGLLATDGSNPLRGASRRRHALALSTLGQHVSGSQRGLLRTWAGEVRLDRYARRGTSALRGTRRVASISMLSTLGLGDEMRDRACGDRNHRVRMCAAETDFAPASQNRIDTLIGLTTDRSPRVRFAARDSLARLGGVIAPSLLPYLDSSDPGVAAAALDVARTTPHPVLLPAALQLSSPDRDGAERLLALRLLSLLDAPERVAVLRDALSDDDPRIRAAAADGLRHAKALGCASALSERLRDPAWEVRRAAGRGLLAMGPVGAVLLRAAVRCDDRYAVDMARTMLKLPPVQPPAREELPANDASPLTVAS